MSGRSPEGPGGAVKSSGMAPDSDIVVGLGRKSLQGDVVRALRVGAGDGWGSGKDVGTNVAAAFGSIRRARLGLLGPCRGWMPAPAGTHPSQRDTRTGSAHPLPDETPLPQAVRD